MADDAAPDTIRVVVVDDHAFVRRGVRAYVDTVPSLEMIGEAGDGEQLLALLHQWRTMGRPLPHVVLMDLQMRAWAAWRRSRRSPGPIPRSTSSC